MPNSEAATAEVTATVTQIAIASRNATASFLAIALRMRLVQLKLSTSTRHQGRYCALSWSSNLTLPHTIASDLFVVGNFVEL